MNKNAVLNCVDNLERNNKFIISNTKYTFRSCELHPSAPTRPQPSTILLRKTKSGRCREVGNRIGKFAWAVLKGQNPVLYFSIRTSFTMLYNEHSEKSELNIKFSVLHQLLDVE